MQVLCIKRNFEREPLSGLPSLEGAQGWLGPEGNQGPHHLLVERAKMDVKKTKA